VIEHHLRRIYEQKNPTGRWIESGMYQAVRDVLEGAVETGMGEGSQGRLPLDTGLSASLAHSAEVFSAFKVHRMQQDMARLLYDDQGNLRSFREWRELAAPIASHQVGPWLETEYSTAVLRAQQAAEWQQFEAEADVFPNLRWVPSTSVHPGADHQVFWNIIRPIHDPFWDQHRPGDRWNCKCSLEATDEKPTAIPKGYELRGNGPQAGLNENPGKTGELFAQSHPYFPQTCAQCAFYQGGQETQFRNAQGRCNGCTFLRSALPKSESHPTPPKVEEYIRQGDTQVYCHPLHGANEVANNLRLAEFLYSKLKTDIYLLPRIHPDLPNAEHLRAQYLPQGVPNGKNTDFMIGGKLFEGKSLLRIKKSGDKGKYENAIQNRIKEAKKQADNIILEIPSFIKRETIHSSVTNFLRQSKHERTIIVVWKNKCLIYGNNKAPDD
jgi:hypothetical protein